MRTGYSVNRIEIVIKVSIEFAAALRAFAARLPADKVPASGRATAILLSTHGPGEWIGESFVNALNKK